MESIPSWIQIKTQIQCSPTEWSTVPPYDSLVPSASVTVCFRGTGARMVCLIHLRDLSLLFSGLLGAGAGYSSVQADVFSSGKKGQPTDARAVVPPLSWGCQQRVLGRLSGWTAAWPAQYWTRKTVDKGLSWSWLRSTLLQCPPPFSRVSSAGATHFREMLCGRVVEQVTGRVFLFRAFIGHPPHGGLQSPELPHSDETVLDAHGSSGSFGASPGVVGHGGGSQKHLLAHADSSQVPHIPSGMGGSRYISVRSLAL